MRGSGSQGNRVWNECFPVVRCQVSVHAASPFVPRVGISTRRCGGNPNSVRVGIVERSGSVASDSRLR